MLSFTLPVGPGATSPPRVPPVTSTAGRHGSDPEGTTEGSLAPWILGGAFLASQMRCEKLRLPPSWRMGKNRTPLKIVWKIFFFKDYMEIDN